jgi:hypothetical protein
MGDRAQPARLPGGGYQPRESSSERRPPTSGSGVAPALTAAGARVLELEREVESLSADRDCKQFELESLASTDATVKRLRAAEKHAGKLEDELVEVDTALSDVPDRDERGHKLTRRMRIRSLVFEADGNAKLSVVAHEKAKDLEHQVEQLTKALKTYRGLLQLRQSGAVVFRAATDAEREALKLAKAALRERGRR